MLKIPKLPYNLFGLTAIALLTVGVFASLTLLKSEQDITPEAGSGDYEETQRRIRGQIEEPSEYNAHIIRSVDLIPDISLEKVRLVGVVFWPTNESGRMEEVATSLQEILLETERFWERALDNKTQFRSELLPIIISGNKTRSEYTPNELHEEVEGQLRSQITDPELLSKILKLFELNKQGLSPEASSDEFLNLVIFVMGSENVAHSSAVFGLTTVYINSQSVLQWRANRIDNLTVHEAGHGLSFPDQYFTGTENDTWWYDSDEKNIMGSGMWNYPLSEMHLAVSVKKWVLNKRTAASTPFPSPTPVILPSPISISGDLDADGDLDIFDYNVLVSHYGKRKPPGATPADIDSDNDVDIFDYNLFVGYYLCRNGCG